MGKKGKREKKARVGRPRDEREKDQREMDEKAMHLMTTNLKLIALSKNRQKTDSSTDVRFFEVLHWIRKGKKSYCI